MAGHRPRGNTAPEPQLAAGRAGHVHVDDHRRQCDAERLPVVDRFRQASSRSPASAELDLNGAAAPARTPVPIPTVTGENTLAFQLGTVPPGTHTFSVQARAGIRTGTFDASLVGVATSGGVTTRTDDATASVAVDENADTSFGPLSDDALYVGHLVSSDDDDVYTTTFEVTAEQAAEGRRGTVYLSNLAVDYDLAIFGPAADPLRAPPIESLVPVDDRQLGADPGSEVVAPDTQYDVPLTAPPGSVLDRIVRQSGQRTGTSRSR